MQQHYKTIEVARILREKKTLGNRGPWSNDIAKWCKEGRIKAFKTSPGGQWRISEGEIDRILKLGKLRDV